eukprot:scaffold307765_cov15-Tisochrysis_lutea.AAC.1
MRRMKCLRMRRSRCLRTTRMTKEGSRGEANAGVSCQICRKVQTLHNMNPFGALVVALSSAKQSKQGMEILLGSRKT